MPYWSTASASGTNPYSAAVANSITFPGAANVSEYTVDFVKVTIVLTQNALNLQGKVTRSIFY